MRPQILEERARLAGLRGKVALASETLRQAHAVYAEIGAEGHAQRLSREISS